MNTYKVKGYSRQAGAIGETEPYEVAIKAESSESARRGVIYLLHKQGRELVTIESCEFGGYDSTPMYLDLERVRNIEGLKRIVESTGSHFFDADSMRFFRSRVADDVIHCDEGILFLTSEQFVSYSPTYRREPRLYTVRLLTYDGDIREVGEFQEYKSLRQARRAAQEYANG